jgi:hypothetical protein
MNETLLSSEYGDSNEFERMPKKEDLHDLIKKEQNL